MKKKIYLLILSGIAFAYTPGMAQTDITNLSGTVSAQYSDSPANEDITKVIDNNTATKYLTFHNAAWIQFQASGAYVVTAYSITSANDAPERDPLSWTFLGSNNGTSWTTLDSRTNQDFPNRFQRREFTFSNTAAFNYYRLQMTNNSGNILQLAEWEIFGVANNPVTVYQHTSYGGTAVALPAGTYTLAQLQARGIQNNWISSVRVASGYHVVLYDYDNFTGNSLTKTADDASLVDDGWNDRATSIIVAANPSTPPSTWQEHWFEHNQLVSRVFYDNDVVVYYDSDMDPSITWLNSYVGNAWRYSKQVYGNMNGGGTDQRLWAIFHQNKYGGGHPSYYFDASHDNRNTIDVGQNGSWANPTGWALDATIHEIGHIVESTTNNAQGSPAFPLWGDSQWCVIYQYDVYVALGWATEAQRWYNQQITSTASYPRANTYWFRDWFYPIWNTYGRSVVLSRFFQLLSQYFPKNGQRYARNMNWGEFVHFWSGAAGINLKSRATTAFGWPAEWETQFNQAQIDFPFTYGQTASASGRVASEDDVTSASDLEEEEKEFAVSIWPNPSTTRTFNISVEGVGEEKGKVEIYSETGNKVSEVMIDKCKANLDLSKQPKGLYIAIIYYGDKVVRRKIRIE